MVSPSGLRAVDNAGTAPVDHTARRMELKPFRMFRGPTFGDRKSGKAGHHNSFFAGFWLRAMLDL
jgi:hypothetical protein